MLIDSRWGKLDLAAGGGHVELTGEINLGGQKYDLSLTLWPNDFGWTRRKFEDLVLTKIGGEQDGKPGRVTAREMVLDHLVERVNAELS
jgi:hypothetical protein